MVRSDIMRIYLVGGAVRNYLLGLTIKERDWLVVGSNPEEMLALGFKQVAKSFPVFLHPVTKEEYALARKERKVAQGYTGFACDTDPNISLQDDLGRRDLTINAIAMDEEGNIYDPFEGQKDLQDRRIRHVSPAFREDPLRVLRTARFAATLHEFGFFIDPVTWSFMTDIVKAGELSFLSKERLLIEFNKSFATKRPDVFLSLLHELGVFKSILKPLDQLSNNDFDFIKTCRSYTKNNSFLLSLLTYRLSDIEDVKSILKELKVPKKIGKLATILKEEYPMLSQISNYDPDKIREILFRTQALRQDVFFAELVECATIMAKSCQAVAETTNLQLAKKLALLLKDNKIHESVLADRPSDVSYEDFICMQQVQKIKSFFKKSNN